MPTFIVKVPEVWYQDVRIEADSGAEAVGLVEQGEGEYLDNRLEYSHTLDPLSNIPNWKVSKE